MRTAFSFSPPSLDALSTMDNDQLCLVAKKIALSHYFKQLDLPVEAVQEYLNLRHEYGVELDFSGSKTQTFHRWHQSNRELSPLTSRPAPDSALLRALYESRRQHLRALSRTNLFEVDTFGLPES